MHTFYHLYFSSKDKIPYSYRIGNKPDSCYYNFWQDATHVQGIWRKTTLDSYKSDNTEWTTVLDLDALPPVSFLFYYFCMLEIAKVCFIVLCQAQNCTILRYHFLNFLSYYFK